MTLDTRSFKQCIGTIDGRRATMLIGARRTMENMSSLQIISCLSIEKVSDEQPSWLDPVSWDYPTIAPHVSSHTTTIRDEAPGMIDEEILAHYRYWQSILSRYEDSREVRAQRELAEQERLNREFEAAIERVRDRFEWRADDC